MSETLVPLVYEGPVDSVRTHHGPVDRGGILRVPEDAVTSYTDGDLFRLATPEEIAAAEAPADDVESSPVDEADPSSVSASDPSLADLIPEQLPAKAADLAELAVVLGLQTHALDGRKLTKAELADSIEGLRADLLAGDGETAATTNTESADAGSDDAGETGEEG